MKNGLVAAVLIATFGFASQARSETRTYSGGFSSRWKTVGLHGHDQPYCGEPKWIELAIPGVIFVEFPDCNPSDFRRANLDNSLGIRTGIERDVASWGALRVVGGAEAGASFTEYNLSQSDFAIVSGTLSGGLDVARWGGRIGARYGLGPTLTTDAGAGFVTYHEVVVTLPLRPGAAIRLSQRSSKTMRMVDMQDGTRDAAGAIETSITFASSPDATGTSAWEFASASGASSPGKGMIGRGLELRRAPYYRLLATREIDRWNADLQLSWTSSSHESVRTSRYRGFEGNQRGKTIDGYGVGLRRTLQASPNWSLRYGAGIEVSDWRDDHHLLFDLKNQTDVVAGVEIATSLAASVRYQMSAHTAFEASAEQLYWTGIRMGERRWGFGLVITR